MEQPTPAAPHTLFVKSGCRYCTLMMNEITQNDMQGEFHVINVDSATVDTSRIRNVPTIIADHQQVLEGREAFAWLNNRKASAVQCIAYSSGKCSWDTMSQSYSFIDGTSGNGGTTNSSLSTVYTTIDGAPPGAAVAAPSQPIPGKESSRSDPLADAMQKLENERRQMAPPPPASAQPAA